MSFTLTYSLLEMAEYQLLKDSSLTWCQTAERGALMTVDSTTEVDVGMDMLVECVVVLLVIGLF